MKTYTIEYRIGHTGIASKRDHTYELEADSLDDAINNSEARDWPRKIEQLAKHEWLITAPDDSGDWEHNVIIRQGAEICPS